MNWAASICPAVEQAVAEFLRGCNLSWIDRTRIFAGLSHGQDDDPGQTNTESVVNQDAMAQIPGPDRDNVPTAEDFVTSPRCVVSCNSAEPAGDWDTRGECMIAHVTVTIETHCDDISGSRHNDMAGELFDRLLAEDAAELLTSAEYNFTAHAVMHKGCSRSRDGHNWVSQLQLDIPGVGLTLT